MNLGAYLQGLIADWLRGSAFPAAPGALTIGISSTDPLADGSGINEPTGAQGYARQVLTFGAITSSQGNGSSIGNDAAITFGPVSGSEWSSIRYVFISAGANMLAYGPLNVARSLPVGDQFGFAPGSIQLKIAGAFSRQVAEAVLGWVKGSAMLPAPSALRLALSMTDPLDNGSALAEVSTADGYQRQAIALSAPAFDLDIGTTLSLAAPIIFGPAVIHAWSQVTHGMVLDQDGLPLLIGPLAAPRILGIGDSLPMTSSTLQLAIR